MFNLFKIKIPKDNAQEVTELESYTVSWSVLTGWSNNTKCYNKCFVKIEDAKEFRKQLEESAKFINAYIETSLIKN